MIRTFGNLECIIKKEGYKRHTKVGDSFVGMVVPSSRYGYSVLTTENEEIQIRSFQSLPIGTTVLASLDSIFDDTAFCQIDAIDVRLDKMDKELLEGFYKLHMKEIAA